MPPDAALDLTALPGWEERAVNVVDRTFLDRLRQLAATVFSGALFSFAAWSASAEPIVRDDEGTTPFEKIALQGTPGAVAAVERCEFLIAWKVVSRWLA